MHVTRHAHRRIKERFGLPRRAAFRLVADAFCTGALSDTDPRLRKFERPRSYAVSKHGRAFIFARDSFTCLTVIDL